MRPLIIFFICMMLFVVANATTDTRESHIRYLVENTFESNIAKCLLVSDVNCTLLENNSVYVQIYSNGVGSFTYSNLEHVSRNILREAIIDHVIAANAYPIVEDLTVQISGNDRTDTFRESRSAINGISEIDLALRPEILDSWSGLVQKMIGTRNAA